MDKQDGGMDIRVHPLVIMSVADHITRSKMQNNEDRVLGALFGVQNGREVHIYECYDIGFTNDDSSPSGVRINFDAFRVDLENYQKAFPQYEVLGWYSSGSKIAPQHIHIHHSVQRLNENVNPLFLMVDPQASRESKQLPAFMFEESLHGHTSTQLVPVLFHVTADEAERIAAVHCAKVMQSDVSLSQVTPSLRTLHKAIAALRERVQVLRNYLSDVSAGKISADAALLQRIKGVCNRLPIMDPAQLTTELAQDYNDALLVNLLSSVTGGADDIHSVVTKFEAAFGDVGRSARGPSSRKKMAVGGR